VRVPTEDYNDALSMCDTEGESAPRRDGCYRREIQPRS